MKHIRHSAQPALSLSYSLPLSLSGLRAIFKCHKCSKQEWRGKESKRGMARGSWRVYFIYIEYTEQEKIKGIFIECREHACELHHSAYLSSIKWCHNSAHEKERTEITQTRMHARTHVRSDTKTDTGVQTRGRFHFFFSACVHGMAWRECRACCARACTPNEKKTLLSACCADAYTPARPQGRPPLQLLVSYSAPENLRHPAATTIKNA